MSASEENRIFDLWLTSCVNGPAYTAVISSFGSAKAFFEANEFDWRTAGIFTSAQLDRLKKRELSLAEKRLKICEENNWRIVTCLDKDFPVHLRGIKDAPSMLYVDGYPEFLSNPLTVAMVGARKASYHGALLASRLAAALAGVGVTIVSGGALGIDTASHDGAIMGGGSTVCVLGCGLGARYLLENESLRKRVAGHGCLVSEYPPFSAPTKATFPNRNRIISGMSVTTVIVEAGERSGSLGTARHALRQGRDLCAVPGDAINSAYTGSNVLIANGARPVFSAADILLECSYEYPELLSPEAVRSAAERSISQNGYPDKEITIPKKPAPSTLSEDQKKVYELFGTEEIGYDELALNSGLNPAKLSQVLVELELEDLIQPLPGNRYAPSPD